ncbi:hypothetical protein GH714_041292 [Hevea brasiliensis]|uniref:PPPDE domain-containing protein n=1 Tax=Hevea brasiliensis TaxID=3981 RepID=A0A6A6MZT9_HEVBR|nr:hypothetical protein GH714_041292 [Hevea brasiliensis]
MGAENISISSSQNENTDAQVVLNVYDLTSVNNYTYWFGFGIFHSGIEVHGKEYGLELMTSQSVEFLKWSHGAVLVSFIDVPSTGPHKYAFL